MLQTYDFEFDRKVVARYATARDKGGYGAKAVVTHSIDSFSAFMRYPLTTGPRRLDPDAFLAFGEHALTGKFWPEEEVPARIGYVRDFLFNVWRREQAPKPNCPAGPRTRDRIWAWQQFETWIVTNQCDPLDQSLLDAFLLKKEHEDGNAGSTVANLRSILVSFRFLIGIPFRLLTQDSVRDFPWQHRNHRNALRQLIEFGQLTRALPASTVLNMMRKRARLEPWGGPFEHLPERWFGVRARIMTPTPVLDLPVIAIATVPPVLPVPVPSLAPLLPVGKMIPRQRRSLPVRRRGALAVMPVSPSVPEVPPVTTPQLGMPLDPGIGVIKQGPILALIADLQATMQQRFDRLEERSDRLERRFDRLEERSDRLERRMLSLISSLADLTMSRPGTFAASVEPVVAPPRETPPEPVSVAPGWVAISEAMTINRRGVTWFWNRLNSGRIEWKNAGTGASPVVMIRNPLTTHPLGTFGSRFPIAPPPPADAVDADFVTVSQAEYRMGRNQGNLRQYIDMGRITNRKRPNIPWEVYWPDADNPPEPIQHLMALITRVIS